MTDLYWIIAVIIAAVIALALYCAAVAGGRADDWAEAYWANQRKGDEDEPNQSD